MMTQPIGEYNQDGSEGSVPGDNRGAVSAPERVGGGPLNRSAGFDKFRELADRHAPAQFILGGSTPGGRSSCNPVRHVPSVASLKVYVIVIAPDRAGSSLSNSTT